MKPTGTHSENTSVSTRNSRIKSSTTGVLFYAALALMVLAVFLTTSPLESGAPRNLFGYSIMRVLTPSMQSVLPQGSLIMTQHVDPNTLHVGDDITFFRLNGTTLTHRIITIYENHEDSGKRGFETQGIENDRADADITSADNVIGKVIYSNLTAGLALSYIRANLVIFAIMSVLLIGLLAALRMVFAPAEAEPALQDCKVRQDIGDGTRPHSGPTTDAIDRGGELCGR